MASSLESESIEKNDGDYIQCDVTKYATDDVFLVGVFSCNDTEWDESRFFCSVYISPESREENRFNPIALAEIFELEYRHLDDLGAHEIVYHVKAWLASATTNRQINTRIFSGGTLARFISLTFKARDILIHMNFCSAFLTLLLQ